MRALAFGIVLLALSSCIVKGYDGPDLPDSEISAVTVHASGAAAIQSVAFDDKNFSGFGDQFKILPGRHSFLIGYRFEDSSTCSTTDPYCWNEVEYGSCRGSITTQPGRNYLITLDNYYSLVKASVLAKGYFDFFERSDEPNIGGVSCSAN